jgi:integrase
MFAWAIARDIEGLESNPCGAAVDIFGGGVNARDRVLTDDEIRLVWAAAEQEAYPFGSLVKALLMSGQRLREIANARWAEIDGDTLAIPAARMKGKVAHSLPLTDRMRELLDGLPRFAGGDYVFTTTAGRRPIGGFSRMKRRLDRRIAASDAVAPWQIHDLRRSMRTGMAEAGIMPFIGELVIGHRQQGVHAVYDKAKYDREKRAALEAWEKRLIEIVEPEPEAPAGKVVALPKRRPRA